MIVHESADARQARARLCNAMLGGGEAYEFERWLLAKLQEFVPHIGRLARNEATFVEQVWRMATGMWGIGQVVHLGAPLPAGHPPHRRLASPGRVVYVEGDELLFRTGLAWLGEDTVDVVRADPLDVPAMIDAIDGRIDWLEPVAVIAPNLLSWVDDTRARTWVGSVMEELPPRSLLATTHLLDPELPTSDLPIEQLLYRLDSCGVGRAFFRRQADIEAMFSGQSLDYPGVKLAADWYPNGPILRDLELSDHLLAAVVLVSRSP
jgi:hypothetical protein